MLEHTPVRICGPVEKGTHTGAGLLAGLVSWGGGVLEQAVPEGLPPMEGTCTEEICEELWPVERTDIGEVNG